MKDEDRALWFGETCRKSAMKLRVNLPAGADHLEPLGALKRIEKPDGNGSVRRADGHAKLTIDVEFLQFLRRRVAALYRRIISIRRANDLLGEEARAAAGEHE